MVEGDGGRRGGSVQSREGALHGEARRPVHLGNLLHGTGKGGDTVRAVAGVGNAHHVVGGGAHRVLQTRVHDIALEVAGRINHREDKPQSHAQHG